MTVSASGGPISDEPREMMTPLVAAGVDVHGFPIACCDEHPECSHVYYCVQVYDACHAELSRLRAVLTQQEAAIAWVMGEGDSDFYSEGERKRLGLPTYWWRREFRRRLAGVRSDMAEQRDVQALAATVREGLHILYAYTSDDANPPGQGRSQTHADSRAALDGLVALLNKQEEALKAVVVLLPDPQRTGQFEDRLTAAQVIAWDALGDDDAGNVASCWETVRAINPDWSTVADDFAALEGTQE